MTARSLDIIKYVDDALEASSRSNIEQMLATDDLLRAEVETEALIRQALITNAEIIDQDASFATVPGVSLLDKLSATAVSTVDNRAIYYVLGVVVLLMVFLLSFIIRTSPTIERNAPPVPMQQKSEETILPRVNEPTKRVMAKPPTSKPVPIEKPNREPIDLDKGLADPPIFTDPKGHMPIKNK